MKNKIRTMKVNVIKAKDKYAKSCGDLDWYDHINGMSARDVELEMEYVFEQATTEMLEMIKLLIDRLEENDLGELNAVKRAKELIKQATEL